MSLLSLRNVIGNISSMSTNTVTTKQIIVQSSIISLGNSTNQTYNNFSNGSFTTGWLSTLTSLTAVNKTAMSQTGQYQVAIQNGTATSSFSYTSNTGVTWTTLTNATNLLPSGSPAYSSVAMSASGQYILTAVNGGLLYLCTNGTAATPTFTTIGITTTPTINYRFENGLTDTMGIASTLTATGSPTYVTGIVGTNAIRFANGAANGGIGSLSQYVTGSLGITLTNFTISAWVNFQSVPTTSQSTVIAIGTGGTTFFELYYSSSLLKVHYYNSSPSTFYDIGSQAISTNTWYHIYIIFQANSTAYFYINNVLIGSIATITISGTLNTIYLGQNGGNALPFNGFIDDLRIYNSAILPSNAIISANFNAVTVSATGQYMMAATTTGPVYRSFNYGATWQPLTKVLTIAGYASGDSIATGGSNTGLTMSNSGQYQMVSQSNTNYITPQQWGNAQATWTQCGITWTASASSVYSTTYAYYAFNMNYPISWAGSPSQYRTSSPYDYLASGTASTVIQGVGTIKGDYLQLQSSVPLNIYSYTWISGNTTQQPQTYYIVGSNDGVTWYPLQYAVGGANNPWASNGTVGTYLVMTTSGSQSFNAGGTASSFTMTTYPYTTGSYTYFRCVATQIWGAGTNISIGQWLINFSNSVSYSTNYGDTWSPAVIPSVTALSTPSLAGNGQLSLVSNGTTAYALSLPNTSTVPLVCYPFNDATGSSSALDYANGFIATSVTGTSGSVTFGNVGKFGTAAYFNGGCYLSLSSNLYTVYNNLMNGSIAFWINQTATNAAGSVLFVKQYNGVGTYSMVGLGMYNNLAVLTPAVPGRIYFTMANLLNSPQCCSNTILSNNIWYHVTITFSSTAVSFYINGVLDNVYYTSWSLPSTIATGMYIGATYSNTTFSNAFTGYLDEFSLWNTTLTAQNVNTLYNLNTTTYNSPCVLPSNASTITGTAVSSTGQYMVVITAATSNHLYYSTNYGVTFTALTLGSAALTTCSISLDGFSITVGSTTTVYTLNWNTQGYSIALGNQAAVTNQGQNAIAIGNQAAVTNQTANSIVINAAGYIINAYDQGFFVAPIASHTVAAVNQVSLLGYGADNQVVQTSLLVSPSGSISKLFVNQGSISWLNGQIGNIPLWNSNWSVFSNSDTNNASGLGIGIDGSNAIWLMGLAPSVAWRNMNVIGNSYNFYTANASGLTTTTPALSINSTSGGVGIGTGTARGTRAMDIIGVANFPLTNAATQVSISDSANIGMNLLLGSYYVDSTNSYSSIQSSLSGVGQINLVLNPAGGNVGIGTSSGLQGPFNIYNSSASYVSQYIFHNTSGNWPLWIKSGTGAGSAQNFIVFQDGSGNQRGSITSTGASTITYGVGSDRRIKNSICDIEYTREVIERIRPRRFKLNGDNLNEYYGFIAQEVREIYPYLVAGEETDTSILQLDYGKFSPFGIAGVQDLYKITDIQNKRINELEYMVATLQTHMREMTNL